ncbi:MAG: lactate utilization protein [Clostridia bacterium]|nr:lactate utilization protein [Clostridia bacterium]
MERNIQGLIINLKNNNMTSYFVDTKEDALELVEKLIPEGASVTNGGSVTLGEVGVTELLRSGKYEYLDRSRCVTREDTQELYRKSFGVDFFLTSSNAVTMNGELYNVDGNANRVANIAYGAKKVIVIVGVNKIVDDLGEAVLRVKQIAAPLNAKRLELQTYCAQCGECVSLKKTDPAMSDGCHSPQRICCQYLVSGFQRDPDRVSVIIVNEELGY